MFGDLLLGFHKTVGLGFETLCGKLPGFDTPTGLNDPDTKLFRSVLQFNYLVGNFAAFLVEVAGGPVRKRNIGPYFYNTRSYHQNTRGWTGRHALRRVLHINEKSESTTLRYPVPEPVSGQMPLLLPLPSDNAG